MQLLQVEVGGIQDYIFESTRLREWRGASALLSRLDHAVLPDVLSGAPAEVVRSGGGVALLTIDDEAPDGTAQRLASTLTERYREEAAGAQAYAAQVAGDAPIPDLLARLALTAGMEREQAPVTDADTALLGSMTRFCDSCGRRPSEKQRAVGDTGELVCRRCFRKGEHGGKVRRGAAEHSVLNRFAEHVASEEGGRWPDPERLPSRVPADLSALAETDPNGEVALILADGNALGKSVQELEDLDTYRSFSAGISGAVETALFDTLAQHPPAEDGPLPWEVVFLGGDDVLLLTAASIALPITETFARQVAERTAPVTEPHGRDHLSMGIGVAAGDPHVPIRVLRRLAGELEESAKELAYARDEEVTTVDYHRITGEGSTTLDHVREHTLRPARDYRGDRHETATRLTGRPFTLDRLHAVREVAARWKEAGLPGSKLHQVREALFESPAEAMRTWAHVVARASDEKRRAWQALSDVADASPTDVELPWTTPADPSLNAAPSRQSHFLDVMEALELGGGV
jgi:hypothetical protein